MKLRVLTFSPEFPPHVVGGLGTHVAAMARGLRPYAELEILVPERGGYDDVPKAISVHEVPCKSASSDAEFWLGFCRAASEAVGALRNPGQVIQCHDWMTVLGGACTSRQMRRPLVYNVHLPQSHSPSRAIEDLGLIQADAVVVNSRAVEAELRARRLPIRRLEVIPNGVDLQTFRPRNRMVRDATVLFVG